MASELLFGGSTPWSSASAPAASVAALGTMQQFQHPPSAGYSSPSHCDPSEWRNVWSVEEESPSPSTLGGSPVESFAGCNETESDEDDCDYIAVLAEQIAHSMLDDDERSEENAKWVSWTSEQIKASAWDVQTALPASPQSTLAGLKWCGSKRSTSYSVASSKGSCQVSSRICSPESIDFEREGDAWDLLYAAAGEVAKFNIGEGRRTLANTSLASKAAGESDSYRDASQRRRQLPVCMKQVVVSSLSLPFPGGSAKDSPLHSRSLEAFNSGSPCQRDGPPSALLSNLQRNFRSKARDEDRGNTGQYLRAPKPSVSSGPGCRGGGRHRIPPSSGGGRHRGGINSLQRSSLGGTDFLSSHHFPPLGPQQPSGSNGVGSAVGSGMRAVFLGPASSRESGGTGVFLPRRIGCGSDVKKKPACSTVLLPSRIVEALNLNIEGVLSGPASPSLIPVSRRGLSSPAASLRQNVDSGAFSASPSFPRREEWIENQWTSARPACLTLLEATSEFNLPTEWTY